VSLALQPIATALFANSPFKEGKLSGFLSTRANVWTDTDNQRSGMPGLMFAEDFGFERYVDWVLDVPMYFVVRDGEMIDLAGQSFRQFMAGNLGNTEIGHATMGDFADHITTVFTDVRVKKFLEMRGADAGTPEMMLAQSALWVGLLYDDAALAAAGELVRRYPWSEYQALRPKVARLALDAPLGTGTVRDIARDMVAIAEQGLRARALRDTSGRDESVHLAPLLDIVHGAPTQAEYWVGRFNGEWRGDVTRIFAEAAI
jgi:glutamate--cysteine ligase